MESASPIPVVGRFFLPFAFPTSPKVLRSPRTFFFSNNNINHVPQKNKKKLKKKRQQQRERNHFKISLNPTSTRIRTTTRIDLRKEWHRSTRGGATISHGGGGGGATRRKRCVARAVRLLVQLLTIASGAASRKAHRLTPCLPKMCGYYGELCVCVCVCVCVVGGGRG